VYVCVHTPPTCVRVCTYTLNTLHSKHLTPPLPPHTRTNTQTKGLYEEALDLNLDALGAKQTLHQHQHQQKLAEAAASSIYPSHHPLHPLNLPNSEGGGAGAGGEWGDITGDGGSGGVGGGLPPEIAAFVLRKAAMCCLSLGDWVSWRFLQVAFCSMTAVCCSVLRCVCSVLRRVAVAWLFLPVFFRLRLQCVCNVFAVCVQCVCSVCAVCVQCVAGGLSHYGRSVLQCVAVYLHCVAVRVQWITAWCSVLQC